jgi:hypothetical protein
MNVGQRRVTRTTSSVPRTRSFCSAVNAARIAIWRWALEMRARAMGPLRRPRSSVRRICPKRSANSGRVSQLRNVSTGRILRRKRRSVHLCLPLFSFRHPNLSASRDSRKSTKPYIPTMSIVPSALRVKRLPPMAKERRVVLKSRILIPRASRS